MKKTFLSFLVFVSMGAFSQEMSYYSQKHENTNISEEEAKILFKSMNKNTGKNSQCYNRAMSWSYDFFTKKGIVHEKVLLYYTNKYRNELSKKWGFHIAPVVTVEGERYAFDPEFLKKPYKMNDWIKSFIHPGERILEARRQALKSEKKNYLTKIRSLDKSSVFYESKANKYRASIKKIEDEMNYLGVNETERAFIECKLIDNVTYWDEHPYEGWCFYQVIPMYYWGPPQLRTLDQTGTEQFEFNSREVWDARAQAYPDYKDIWKKEWEEYKGR